jgi:hypothetical protein
VYAHIVQVAHFRIVLRGKHHLCFQMACLLLFRRYLISYQLNAEISRP